MNQRALNSRIVTSIGVRSVGTALLLAGLMGCSGGASDGSLEIRTRTEAMTLDSASQFSLIIPTQVVAGTSAVVGADSVKWGDRATIIADGANGVITAGEFGDIEIGHDSNVRSVISPGAVTVRARAKVDGDLIVQGSSQVDSAAQVFGDTQLGASVPTQTAFEMPVYFPEETGGDVHLEPDQELSLTPADYGTVAVKSRSTITLSTGTYDFDTLQVAEPQAKLLIDDEAGPVVIYVREQFTYRGDVQIQSTTGGFPNLLIVYLGQSDLWLEAPFQGHIFAPNSSSHIRPMQGAFTGSVWGRDVEVHPGTLFIHQPFDLATFFLNIRVDNTPYIFGQSRPVIPDPTDFRLPSRIPDGVIEELPGPPPENLGCDSELAYEVDPDDPSRLLRVYYLSEEEKEASSNCVADYFECADNGDGTVGTPYKPSEEELNAAPDADSSCEALSQRAPCGTDDSVLDLPESQRPTCETEDDCSEGQVCASYCLGADCAVDEFVSYCADLIESCTPLPEESECEVRNVCPEPDYTGPEYKKPAEDTSKAELNPEEQIGDEEPVLAGYERPGCTAPTIEVKEFKDESVPVEASGNDKWGIDFSPTVNYGFTTPSSATPSVEELSVNGKAEFNVYATVWKKKVPVLEAGLTGSISPTSLEFDRTSKLFGQQVDITGDVVGEIKESISGSLGNQVRTAMEDVELQQKSAEEAFANLFWIRDVIASNDILGNPQAGQEFCELAQDVLPNSFPVDSPDDYCNPLPRCEDKIVLCGECESGEQTVCEPIETVEEATQRFNEAVQIALNVWKDEYQEKISALGDPETAMRNALEPVRDELPGSNPDLTTDVPFEAARHRFSALRYQFTFPVGPIPVVMEIELGGSWGVDAALELSADFEDELYARAGAAIIPGMDIQALAFAGINLGFASAGVGGELTLIEIEIPVKGGAEIRGQRIADDRPLTLAIEGGAQDLSALAADLMPLTTTKWTGGFWYGAGMRITVLSGNVNLQARVNLLFFKKRWKKILASWNGKVFERSFVGSIQAAKDLELPEKLQKILTDVEEASEGLEDVPALVPLWDAGATGHFGSRTPLLSEAAAAQLAWPPAYEFGMAAVPIPTKEQLCVDDGIVVK